MWTIYDAVAQDATAYTGVNENYYREPLFNDSHFVPEVVLENCSISDDKTSFLTYGVNGNTYYEVVVENVNGQVQVNSYVSGTYERPQTKILLQPINK